jgi:uncharacterized damage-inducible protein DinB
MTHTEIETLCAYQDGQRRHVLGILEGLGEEELRRPVLPSGWTCLGLVSHLALDIERFWFRAVVAGEQTAIEELTSTGDAWLVPPEVPAREIFDLYRAQIVLANEVIAATPAQAAPAWWPAGHFGGWRLHNLREILLHVITETACHAGHLDAARELIDGRMWRVLT